MISKSRARSVATKRRTFRSTWTTARTLTATATGLRPNIENIIEVGHTLHTLREIVMQRGKELVIAQLRIIYLLLVEGSL